MIFRRSSAGSKLSMWWRRLPSISSTPFTHSSPAPKKAVLYVWLSSLLASFRASRLGTALIGDGIRRRHYISFGRGGSDEEQVPTGNLKMGLITDGSLLTEEPDSKK